MHHQRRWMAAGIVGALFFASWGLFLVHHLVLTPFKRQATLLGTAGLRFSTGPVVLIGDSIAASLQACDGVLNWAVPGMQAADLGPEHIAGIRSSGASRVIVMLGINDLRDGRSAADTAAAIAGFAGRLISADANRQVLVIGLLPIVEAEINGTARNEAIAATNQLLLTKAVEAGALFVDIRGLFGGSSLDSSKSYDGLHLNAAGRQDLFNALFGGLSPPRQLTSCGPR